MSILNDEDREKLFWDNANWNAALAPRRAKLKRRGGIFQIMRPDELIKRVLALEVSIDRRTLSRYVKAGLVTSPEYRHGGKGRGPIVDYPEHAVVEAATAAVLIQRERWKIEHVAEARKTFLTTLKGAKRAVNEEKLLEIVGNLTRKIYRAETKSDRRKKLIMIQRAFFWYGVFYIYADWPKNFWAETGLPTQVPKI